MIVITSHFQIIYDYDSHLISYEQYLNDSYSISYEQCIYLFI